jgi:hypothetical protein
MVNLSLPARLEERLPAPVLVLVLVLVLHLVPPQALHPSVELRVPQVVHRLPRQALPLLVELRVPYPVPRLPPQALPHSVVRPVQALVVPYLHSPLTPPVLWRAPPQAQARVQALDRLPVLLHLLVRAPQALPLTLSLVSRVLLRVLLRVPLRQEAQVFPVLRLLLVLPLDLAQAQAPARVQAQAVRPVVLRADLPAALQERNITTTLQVLPLLAPQLLPVPLL